MELSQLEAGIAAYLDAEIIPAMTGASQLRKLGIAAVIAQAKSSGFITRYFNMMVNDPMFIALNVVTEDGKIGDINTICNSLKEAIQKTGPITVPLIDMKFNADDVDVLRRYLQGGSHAQAQYSA